MTNVATSEDAARAVGRPLKELVTLIKADMALAKEAAQEAALPYYISIGEKLIEAKAQLPHGEFQAWCKHNFGVAPTQVKNYISYARATVGTLNGSPERFPTMDDHLRARGHNRDQVTKQPWHQPIKESLGKVDPEKYEEKANRQADERLLQRQLAVQLIDIGYKALATKLHPDAGGSSEAMKRLNAVKAKLKACVSKY